MPYAQNSGVSVTTVLKSDRMNDAMPNSKAAVTTCNTIIMMSHKRKRKKFTPAPEKNVEVE